MAKCKVECQCGRHQKSEEWREKQRVAHMGRTYSPESIEKMRQAALGRTHTPETKEKLRQFMLNEPPHHTTLHTPEAKVKCGAANIGREPWNKGKTGVYTEETLQNIRNGVKRGWREGKLTTTCQVPNKSEQYLAAILEPYGFTFVGNRQLIINGKNPDFWDGGVKLIELAGDHWHEPIYEHERSNFFKQSGYSCLVIWESKLFKNLEEVKASIKIFAEAP